MDRAQPGLPDRGWNRYWTGAGRAGAYGIGGVNHPVIDAFWTEFFAAITLPAEGASVVDHDNL